MIVAFWLLCLARLRVVWCGCYDCGLDVGFVVLRAVGWFTCGGCFAVCGLCVSCYAIGLAGFGFVVYVVSDFVV